jgi:hypothetical protein
MLQAKTFEEIEPLVDLIAQGKLFDVQQWIADGKPINPPPHEPKKPRKAGPLEHALATSFHSMIQILLN